MTTFDIAIILGGACGICMVLGGMVLLYKGAISLSNASQSDAVDLEFKKLIRISTHYPALGLFIIGLAFVLVSIECAKPTQSHFTITGQIRNASVIGDLGTLTVMVGTPKSWEGKAYADGQIIASIVPTIDILEVTLSAPGFKETTRAIQTKTSRMGAISIGDIELVKVIEKPPVDPANIVPLEKPLAGLSPRAGL
ncbi:MAG: hypothetical protein LAQ69_04610 [Acidobacteriia bacterium]|nr:hypothetical protein [Terriglobia bacterium]